MVKCLPVFEYFTVFLKNKNIISKIRRSKFTDYATLTLCSVLFDLIFYVPSNNLLVMLGLVLLG